MAFTDINVALIQKLPARWRPYALLMRLDRPAGWWLLLLPGWWGIVLSAHETGGMDGRTFYLMGLFLIGAVVMRGAGCVINDLWDRDIDARVERTRARPLAAGTVSVQNALLFLGVLLFIGALILLQLSRQAIFLGLLSMLLVMIYPLMKRITWWPQAFLGITFNFGALIGGAAVAGEVSFSVLILYLAGVLWTLGYDTIYAHQDKDDDAVIGIKSTARLFGDKSRVWVAGFYAGAWGLMMLAGMLGGAGIFFFSFMVFPALHLAWQVWRWNPDEPASSLGVFKSGRDFGGLILLSFLFAGL
jgi:4-hydroxybenzoate polyprenyltransferase